MVQRSSQRRWWTEDEDRVLQEEVKTQGTHVYRSGLLIQHQLMPKSTIWWPAVSPELECHRCKPPREIEQGLPETLDENQSKQSKGDLDRIRRSFAAKGRCSIWIPVSSFIFPVSIG